MKTWMSILLLTVGAAAQAAPPTKESISTLLQETRIERSIDGIVDTMERVMQQQMATVFAGQPVTPEQQRVMQGLQARTVALLRSEMTWQNLEPVYVQVYQEVYTQAEIDGLIAFYRTPTGRSYVDKMPLALQRTLAAMQPLMASMMQKSQALAREAIDEARSARP